MKRRDLIKMLPLASGLASIPATVLSQEPDAAMTPQERREYHLAGYKSACEELDPTIDRWGQSERGSEMHLTAFKVSGRYVGDGAYEFATRVGTKCINVVRLLPEKINGHRAFAVTPWPGIGTCEVMTEQVLQRTIGKFVS